MYVLLLLFSGLRRFFYAFSRNSSADRVIDALQNWLEISVKTCRKHGSGPCLGMNETERKAAIGALGALVKLRK